MKNIIFSLLMVFSHNVFAQECIEKSSALDVVKANIGSDEFMSMDSHLRFEKHFNFIQEEQLYRYIVGNSVNSNIIIEVTCLGAFDERLSSWPE